MPVRLFAKYSKRVSHVSYVDIVSDPYIQQCIQDLKDTLQYMQYELDRKNPDQGGGVGLAASQLEFPYCPISAEDKNPAPGFYPENFVAPNIYVVHIRHKRAQHEACEPCPLTVYINSVIIPLDGPDERPAVLSEQSFSIMGFQGVGVPRYNRIKVFAQDMSGLWNEHQVSGFPARIHQHEADSVLYLSRLLLSTEEMQQIRDWITSPNLVPLSSIVPGKLLCTSESPDINLLKDWVDSHSNTTSHAMRTHRDAHRSNPKVVVIGASRGLGLAFVRHYLKYGYSVIATHRETQTLTALQVYQSKYPEKLSLVTLDVTNHDSIEQFAKNLSIGSGDLIIYNAAIKGYEPSDMSLEEDQITAVRSVFNVNYLGQYSLIKALYKKLLHDDVLWVNVSSLVGMASHLNSGYADPRERTHGLVQDTYLDLADDWQRLGREHSRVPCAISVCPGWKVTTTGEFKYHADSDQIIKKLVRNCIVVAAGTKMPGVYLYTGERQEKYLQSEWIRELLINQKNTETKSSVHGLNSMFKAVNSSTAGASENQHVMTHRKSI